jgi:H+/Cl- antiporter ClcA/predicted transcriptional regulator
MGPTLESMRVPRQDEGNRHRTLVISAIAVGIACFAALAAEALIALIGLITNLGFYGRFSFAFTSPRDNTLGLAVVLVPVIGALIVGVMARYGSPAIRGHGIPEAMERVLYNQSRISARVTLLKPLSAAVSIGTGGPFGAEGPIIATGGALGSLVGQVLQITADERKVLLAAGAAAGMAATFGSPVSAILLAVELLVFEYRPRSLIPIALASTVAAAVRMAFHGSAPVFAMPDLSSPSGTALASYVLLGAVVGLLSVYITRAVYAIEDAFERLPVHWMWWPAIGAVVVGVVGFLEPRTLGVGYDNIDQILSGSIVGYALAALVVLKLISWSVALGSGTSGGTLAPLFTIGGGLGSMLAAGGMLVFPGFQFDIRVAGLVGMAAMFSGASHAMLTSIIFAFETTRQPLGLLPLLGGCSAAYLISIMLMRHSIMTERLARRGAPVPTEYTADYLHQLLVRDHASTGVATIRSDETVEAALARVSGTPAERAHNGFPVVTADGRLVGVVTRRDLNDPTAPRSKPVGEILKRPPVVIHPDNTLREAADHMVHEKVGRLPVIPRKGPPKVIGIITRSDLLEAHQTRLEAADIAERSIELLPWRDPPVSRSSS